MEFMGNKNEMMVFNNEEFGNVRVVNIDGEGWLLGKDVAEILGYKNHSDALNKHVDNEDKMQIAKCDLKNYDDIGTKGAIAINESGLYSLALRSKLPDAKKFKRWVTSEVLPQIRQTGGYIPIKEEDDELTIMSKAYMIAQKTIDKKQQLIEQQQQLIDEQQEVIETQKPKVEFADAVSSAMRSAFQSGENAARAMRNSVKESIGDMIEEIMKLIYLKPAIESAMEQLLGGDRDQLQKMFEGEDGKFDSKKATAYLVKRLTDPDNVDAFFDTMQSFSDGYINLYESMDDRLKEYFAFNPENSTLSGGISGVSEDTARALEGIGNSSLAQLVIANNHLASIQSHLMATIQISWFNGMLEQAKATRLAAERIDSAIDYMRKGVSPLYVKVV